MNVLPKLSYPTYDITVPSTKATVNYRPMRVADEKILLMAKEGDYKNEIFKAIKQVVQNCSEGIDVNNITLFDLEYFFIKIRSASIGNMISITIRDENNKEHTLNVNIDDVAVKWPEKSNSDFIKISSKAGIKLKYPSCSIYESPVFEQEDVSELEIFDELVYHCLDSYVEGDNVIDFKNLNPDEVKEWLNDLDVKTYQKIRDFVQNQPTIYHEVKYDGDKVFKLTTLTDFFSF